MVVTWAELPAGVAHSVSVPPCVAIQLRRSAEPGTLGPLDACWIALKLRPYPRSGVTTSLLAVGGLHVLGRTAWLRRP
jgi:hypothetical protein